LTRWTAIPNPAPTISKGSSLEDQWRPGLTWSNLWKNGQVKQTLEVTAAQQQ